ncbi:hypothetical protein ABG808_12485 [Streptococcus iniae]
MKKACATCGKFFEATSNRATYCSEECRKIGVSEKQKLLMRKKRKEEKERKEAKLKTNIENRTKPKKYVILKNITKRKNKSF